MFRRGFYPLAPLRIFSRATLIAFAALTMPSPTDADELLLNGSFESSSYWTGIRFSIPGVCTGRSGDGATLSPDSTAVAYVQQTAKVNSGAGPYTLSGYVKLQSGSSSVTPQVRWLDSAGNVVLTTVADVAPATTYASFTLTPTMAPMNAVSSQIRVTAASGAGATVCLDDLSFNGPAFAQPSPTFTPTPTPRPPSATPSPTATATRTPVPTRTPTETHTPRPTREPTETHTPRPTTEPTDTHTPRPTTEATDTHTPRPTRESTETHTPRPTAGSAEVPGASIRNSATGTAARRANAGGASSGSTGSLGRADSGSSQDGESVGDPVNDESPDLADASMAVDGPRGMFSDVEADVAPVEPDEPAAESDSGGHSVGLIFIVLGLVGGLVVATIFAKRKQA